MKNITVKDILELTNGELVIGNQDFECENFSKDTRQIKENDIYVGIKGEKFDGNLFWKEALEKGAKCVIVENIDFSKESLDDFRDKIIIEVENTLEALYKIAAYKRKINDIPVVAITGSVGKTSTKDMIASVVSQKYKTLKTIGNDILDGKVLVNPKNKDTDVCEYCKFKSICKFDQEIDKKIKIPSYSNKEVFEKLEGEKDA